MSTTLFRSDEREAVENSFGHEPLYSLLAGTTRRIMNGAETLVLHPAELFYQAFYIIDTLHGLPPREQVAWCGVELWDELYDYLRHEKQVAATQGELQLAIATIMQAAYELLVRSADRRYLSAAAALKRALVKESGDSLSDLLDSEFHKGFKRLDEDEQAQLISPYLQGGRYYSDEIADLLDAMPPVAAGQEAASGAAGQEAMASHVRIATSKRTSVLVVLDAMYKVGWLVDEEGNKLTNRDAALRSILRAAFGCDCRHIAQMLSASNNPDNLAKAERILQELLAPTHERKRKRDEGISD